MMSLNSRLHLYMWSPACQQLVMPVAEVEVTLRVFGVVQRECVNPFLCAGKTLIPVV